MWTRRFRRNSDLRGREGGSVVRYRVFRFAINIVAPVRIYRTAARELSNRRNARATFGSLGTFVVAFMPLESKGTAVIAGVHRLHEEFVLRFVEVTVGRTSRTICHEFPASTADHALAERFSRWTVCLRPEIPVASEPIRGSPTVSELAERRSVQVNRRRDATRSNDERPARRTGETCC